MKLKYYLRGLGIGIVITTLILMIAFSGHKETLSDDEIRQRAEELGMVMAEAEDTSVMDESSEYTETETGNISEDETETESIPSVKENTQTDTEVQTEANTESDTENEPDTEKTTDMENMSSSKASVEPENKNTPDTGTDTSQEEVSFTISPGESSDTIAFNLYKAGLVDNASEFNRYMISNNYDSRLRTGTYNIKKGMSYEEVMKVLLP